MAAEPFILSFYFIDFILPFLLVFVLVFAILEKSKLLGDESKKVNAIIGLIIGLILIATPFARDIVVELMPFLAIVAVILLVFMLLYGFIVAKKEGDVLNNGLKITFGILVGLALLVFLLIITGFGQIILDFVFNSTNSSNLLMNGVIIVIIIVGLVAVLWGSGKGGDKNK